MTDEQYRRLKQLKKNNKNRIFEANILKIKKNICLDIPEFEKYFRFSETEESAKLKVFVSSIPSLTPTRPDFNAMPYYEKLDFATLKENNGRAWLAFLCGGEELFDIFIFGRISDIVKYIFNWEYLSEYIILIFEDMNRFIFIDDEREAVELATPDENRTPTFWVR